MGTERKNILSQVIISCWNESPYKLSQAAPWAPQELVTRSHACFFHSLFPTDSNRGALNLGNRRLFKELQKLANSSHASPLGHAAVPYGAAALVHVLCVSAMLIQHVPTYY